MALAPIGLSVIPPFSLSTVFRKSISLFIPRDTYVNAEDWEVKAKDLAGRFIKNFSKYTNTEEGKALVAAGPQL